MAAAVIDQVFGRINDADTHELVPAQLWEREFGEGTATVAKLFAAQPPEVLGPNTFNIPIDADEAELSADTIWTTKGGRAPGALDMRRRLEVMDLLGIDRSLIFPTGPGLVGFVLANSPREFLRSIFNVDSDIDTVAEGRKMCAAHNDWCIKVAKISPRLRPVAIVDTASIPEALREAERVIDAGVKAVMIPCGSPPGGVSPSHPDVDPLWQLLTEANVPLLLHVGSEFGFLRSTAWAQAPHFAHDANSPELLLDAYSTSTMYFAAANFVAGMVLGGVFERFPTLHVGVIEICSHWVGSMAENMDTWGGQFKRRLSKVLSMPPSEYLKRNVRVSSFWFERVDKYIDRYGLEDVYVYSTDYPHFESGPHDSRALFAEQLSRHGDEVVEKFFVRNAEILLP